MLFLPSNAHNDGKRQSVHEYDSFITCEHQQGKDCVEKNENTNSERERCDSLCKEQRK